MRIATPGQETMGTLRFLNTFSGTLEEFVPLEPPRCLMYNCGPTVYNDVHIGNLRAFVFADVLRRYLEYRGYQVRQVVNITDVGHLLEDSDEGEDKIEVRAREERKDPWEIADFYARRFFEDIAKLNIRRAAAYPRATEHISDMIEMIERLVAKGYAYVVNGSVYYDVRKFQPYGRLSGKVLSELKPGSRVEVHQEKHYPLDFCLWIRKGGHIMQWDSPWGRGYPGWHIECSAMAWKLLGETIDIHTGGEDNIFPHHESEIAQSEACHGKKFVRYWLHTKHLLVDGKKMSKSAGNFYTLRDLEALGYAPVAIRYLLLSAHYRQPLNFTLPGLEAAATSVGRLRELYRRLEEVEEPRSFGEAAAVLEAGRLGFEEGFDDDLNASRALAALFTFVKEANRLIDQRRIGRAEAEALCAALRSFDSVLGIEIAAQEELRLAPEAQALLREREEARSRKDYRRADEIRERLRQMGIEVTDTAQGQRYRKR